MIMVMHTILAKGTITVIKLKQGKDAAAIAADRNTARKPPYFISPGMSCKAQKCQVTVIFPSVFRFKKYRISHLQKV